MTIGAYKSKLKSVEKRWHFPNKKKLFDSFHRQKKPFFFHQFLLLIDSSIENEWEKNRELCRWKEEGEWGRMKSKWYKINIYFLD